MRQLDIWLNPHHVDRVVAAESGWSVLGAALDRCVNVPTVELSGVCPEIHEVTVKRLLTRMPKRLEGAVSVRHLRNL